jgi:methyl-accepting chemotaxis protein
VESDLRKLLAGAQDTLREELDEIAGEAARVRALLGEAVGGLSQSFIGLAQQAEAQKQVLEGLLVSLGSGRAGRAGDGSPSMDAFVRECANILSSLAVNLEELSTRSSASVTSIDALTGHFDKSMALLSEIETISTSARLLSLNARIEAARSGDAGRGFAVVASEVKEVSRYSRELAERISEHVDKVRGSLVAVRAGISEAAARGSEVATRGKQQVETTLSELDSLGGSVARALAELGGITAQVNETAARAIRALQFEDIIGQLVGTMLRRVDRLRQVRQALAAALGSGGAAHGLAILERSQEITSTAPVQQQSMAAGDVELF